MFFSNEYSWHILGDRLSPEQLLWVDRGILHVGPTKSLTFSPGDLRVAMYWLKKILYMFTAKRTNFLVFFRGSRGQIPPRMQSILVDNFIQPEIFQIYTLTPPKTNMEPENGPLEKEIPIGNHHFQVPC